MRFEMQGGVMWLVADITISIMPDIQKYPIQYGVMSMASLRDSDKHTTVFSQSPKIRAAVRVTIPHHGYIAMYVVTYDCGLLRYVTYMCY